MSPVIGSRRGILAWAIALAMAMAAATPALAQHAGHAAAAEEPADVDHAAMGHGPPSPAPAQPLTPIPPITDADRIAARLPEGGHAHEAAPQSFVLFDRLETWRDDGETGVGWETAAWIGGDRHKLWLRSEGEREHGHTGADLEILYGRPLSAWWDLVAGVRQEFGDGPDRSWAAFGVTGMTPYKFEFAATAYVDADGRSEATVELEYETLLTNRLILQSMLEATVAGRDDPARGVGAGLSVLEGGLRLRYEFDRRFAPYVGVVHERAFGTTADWRRAAGGSTGETRVVAGVRVWF